MIPRKKIQSVLYTLYILYAFGNEEYASANSILNKTDDYSDSLADTILLGDNTSLDSVVYTTVHSEPSTTNNYTRVTEVLETTSSFNYTSDFSTLLYTSVAEDTEETSSFNYASDSSTLSYSTNTEDVEGASSPDGTSWSTVSLDETTTEMSICKDRPSSVQNLTVASIDNTLIVTWQPVISNEECTLQYNITWYTDTNYLNSRTVDSTKTEFTISGLTPCTLYIISVFTIAKNGISDEETVSVNTTESPISQVNNLIVSTIHNGLNVTWEPPEDVSCLKSYFLNIATQDNATQFMETVPSQVTVHVIYNLSTCTLYTVQVTPISINNNSGTIATINETKTSSDIPGVVNDLTAPNDKLTGYSVYLTWSAPTLNPNCVLHYNINICYEDNCIEANTINLFYNVTELTPCLNYTFTVSALGEAGASEPASTTAKTSYITPGAPASVVAVPGQFSLFVSWEPPTTGRFCTASYHVTLWDDEKTENTTNRNITFFDLYACKNYTVEITPIGIEDGENHSSSVSEIIEASVNDPPELEIDEPEVTKNTIYVVWRINRTMNECKLKTVLSTCNFTSTNGHGFVPVKQQSSESDILDASSSAYITIGITLSNLSPFSTYKCTATIQNVAGYSESSSVITATTSEDVPSAPVMAVSSVKSSTFTLVWNESEYLAGNLITYEIFLSWEPLFLMPSSCVYHRSSITISNIEGSQHIYEYSTAAAYSTYIASIRAKTNAGWGNYSNYVSFKTTAGVPGTVTKMTYSNISSVTDSNVLDTVLYWGLPCSLNGEIESFHVHYDGVRNGFPNDIFRYVYHINESINAENIFNISFGELNAEYNYTFKIFAKVTGVSELGLPTSYNVIYPAGIPPMPEQSYMDKIKIDPYHAERTASTAWVLLPLFNNSNGDIIYYAVLISEIGPNNYTANRFDILSGNWPNSASWGEAMSHVPSLTYQATPIRWYPNTTSIISHGDLKAIKFELGNDASCSKLPTAFHCNGPLQPNTQYHVQMRAFTSGGYRDSTVIIAKTEAEFNLGMVIGVVFGILFFGITTTMMLLIRKGVLQTVLSNILHPSVQSSPGPEPFTRKKFALHCHELIENPGKLSNEFQLLQTLSVDLEMSANAAGLQTNRKKNRYINILPYDISRVKLEVLNNDPNTDYINASLIQGYGGATEYIACQGPKEETTYDFWRMIFQYNVKIIVMLTQLVEKGKDKCYQYYPNTRDSFELEDIIIRCSTQLDFAFYAQRIITLQRGNIKRTVMHLHFKEWSDHGVPDDVHSMLHFCQVVRKLMNDNRGLVVVHCSAGVGRTGTLIAIDILLQQIKDNKKLDVFGTVYKLRQDRMNMVQTESQYAYIYNCIKQALNNPYPPKHYQTPSAEPMYENLTKKKREITDSVTNLVNSAETLKKMSPSPSTGSMDLISEVIIPQRPIYGRQLSTLSTNGLRYSKSTSAINTQTPPNLELGRYGSHDYPIFEPAPESPSHKASMDIDSLLKFTRPMKIETGINHPRPINMDDNTAHSMYGIRPIY